MPSGGLAGRLAQLIEGVEEREQRAVVVRLELEPQRLVSPGELENRRWFEDHDPAVARRPLAVFENEAQRSARPTLAVHPCREPGPQVLRIGDRAPHLVRRMRQEAREGQA